MKNDKMVFARLNKIKFTVLAFIFYFYFYQVVFAQDAIEKVEKFNGTREMEQMLQEFINKVDFLKMGGLIINEKGAEIFKEELKKADVDHYNYVRAEYANQLLLSGKVAESIEETDKIIKEATNNENYKGPALKVMKNFLALCYFRMGEQENCILGNTANSCIYPLKGDGIYKIKSPTRKAISLYLEILKNDPKDLESRWLLNLGYMALGIYPDSVPKEYFIPANTFDSGYKMKKFNNVAHDLGLDIPSLAGSVCLEDFDNDGDLDVFVDNESFSVPCRYFENIGDGTFAEKTKEAGLSGIIAGRMLATADFDNDGFTDIFITRGAWMAQEDNYPPNSLLRNNGNGSFSDVTIEENVLSFYPTSCASWADVNNDGFIDLFIGNETQDQTIPHPCELFINNGRGKFNEMSKEMGIEIKGFVKSISWGDYNNDGWQDLYVSISKGSNKLFKNNGKDSNGNVSFTEVGSSAGVTKPYYGFPAFFFDFDNDGWLDIFAGSHSLGYLDISSIIPGEYLGIESSKANYSKLYHNNHDGTFTDIAEQAKLNRTIYAMSCSFGDIDNDGFVDIYAGTGYLDLRFLFPNVLLRNSEGKYFQDISATTGTGHLQKGHGISFGDIDNDGDQDIYVVVGGGYSGDAYMNALFENPGNSNNWITLKLEGTKSNRSAIGAKIKVAVLNNGKLRTVFASIQDEGTLATSSLQQEIGLGTSAKIKSVEVEWPSGLKEVFSNVAVNGFYKIKEGENKIVKQERKKITIKKSTSNSQIKMKH